MKIIPCRSRNGKVGSMELVWPFQWPNVLYLVELYPLTWKYYNHTVHGFMQRIGACTICHKALTTPGESTPSSKTLTGSGRPWPCGHVPLQVVQPASVQGLQVEVALTERNDEKLVRNSRGGKRPSSCRC